MGWNRHKLLWDGNGTDKYVPWMTLSIFPKCMVSYVVVFDGRITLVVYDNTQQ